MRKPEERIKQRLIALEKPTETVLETAMKFLSAREGVLAVKACKNSIRVHYCLRQTGIEELLAELHSHNIHARQTGPDGKRLKLSRLLERHERDNLLSRSGWWQRVQAIHIACQRVHRIDTSRNHGPRQ